MLKRQLGDTGISTSIVGLGGGQFADSDHSVNEIRNIIQTALDNGINFIDTAVDYGEERIGEALKDVDQDYYITSKTLAKDKSSTLEDIKNSLDKLNQDKIDFYYMHNPMDVEDYKNRKRNGVLDGLKEAKDDGLINYIGISSDYVEPLELAITDDIDLIMNQYNIGNTLGENLIEKANNRGIGVVASKPFAGGILVDPKPEVEKSKSNEMTPDKALKFTLSNENISTAFVGARYPWQIEECAEICENFDSSSIDRRSIRKKTFKFLGKNFCRDCRYCWPCEELGYEFDIPEILRFLDMFEKYSFKRFPRIEFSQLPYKNKIKEIDKCSLNCPFDINIRKRLNEAKSKLELKLSEDEWIDKCMKYKDKITSNILKSLKDLKDKNEFEAIEIIHTELIPSNVVNQELGTFLIEGIYSFGTKEVYESLKVFR